MTDTINKLQDRAVFRLKAFGQVPNRLYDELDYINDHGGADALLLLSDLVRHLKSEDIYVGPGYGYSTNSILCYGLGITDIEPTRWGLPFERFTNSFNQDNDFWIETSAGGFEKAVSFLNHRCEYPISLNPEKKLVIDIILPDDQQFFNLHLAITHNLNLDIIKALSVERTIKPSKIELDQKALNFFRDGDVNDIYGFAGHEHQRLLGEFQPECFSDIYLFESLYRPDTLNMIQEIQRRKRENDIPATGIPEVDSILMESYGTLVYQEQAIRIKQVLRPMDEDEIVAAVKKMLDVPVAKLYLKGHAISRTMMSVELAYYKARIPDRYELIQRNVRIEAIKTARERIRKRMESQNKESTENKTKIQ